MPQISLLYFQFCISKLFMDNSFAVDYMVEKLGIDRSKIFDLGNLLYKNYGTTMAGLRVWFWFFFSFYFVGNLWPFVAFLCQFFCLVKWKVINYVLWSLAGNWLWLWLWWIPWVGIFLLLFVSCTPLVVLVLNFYWPFIFMSYSFVHGRLPYENLKPDPVMRSLLLSLPYRKVVSNLLPNGIIVPSKGQRCDCLPISYDLSFSFSFFK